MPPPGSAIGSSNLRPQSDEHSGSPRPGYPTRGDWAAQGCAKPHYVNQHGLARQQRGSGRSWSACGFCLAPALKNFLGYGRAFLPARGLIVRNAHIGKPRVSRGDFWPPVAFGARCRPSNSGWMISVRSWTRWVQIAPLCSASPRADRFPRCHVGMRFSGFFESWLGPSCENFAMEVHKWQ